MGRWGKRYKRGEPGWSLKWYRWKKTQKRRAKRDALTGHGGKWRPIEEEDAIINEDMDSSSEKILVPLAVEQAIKTLRPREQTVVVFRVCFGFTYEEVGQMIGGVCRERVRQIEGRAIRRLQHPRHWSMKPSEAYYAR